MTADTSRAGRLRELTTDAQGILAEASQFFVAFQKANATLNTELAAVYAQSGLGPPAVTTHDVLVGTKIADDVDTTTAEVRIADIVVDMGGAVAMTELAPAATVFLVDAGALDAAVAGTALASTLGIDITVGSLVGGVVGAVVVGIVGGAVAAAVDALTSSQSTIALRGGIAAMKTGRERAALSRDRLRVMIDVVKASAAACDQLLQLGLLDEATIANLIEKQARPALADLAAVNRTSVLSNLYTLDVGRGSWLQDG